MRAMRGVWLAATMVAVTLAIAGCSWFRAPSTGSTPPSGKSRVVVEVEWNNLPAYAIGWAPTKRFPLLALLEPVALAQSSSEINVVGAHLEYPNENAYFAQSVTRQQSETVGLITLDVPATSYANLYVVGIKYDPTDPTHARNRALLFGVKKGFQIPEGGTRTFRIYELSLSEPTWYAEDPTQWAELQAGYLTVNGADSAEIPIRVWDPFQVGFTPTDYSQLIIQVYGARQSYRFNNTDGYRPFVVRWFKDWCSRCATEGLLAPYVPGSLFRLPAEAFIPPVINETGWFHIY